MLAVKRANMNQWESRDAHSKRGGRSELSKGHPCIWVNAEF